MTYSLILAAIGSIGVFLIWWALADEYLVPHLEYDHHAWWVSVFGENDR